MTFAPLPYSAPTGSAFRIPVFDTFVVIAFFLFCGNTVEKIFRPLALDHVIYFSIYLAAAGYLFLFGYLRQLPRAVPVLLILIVLPVVSVFWSIDPRATLLRGAEVLGPSLFALLIGWHFRTADLINRLALASLLTLGLSLLLVLLVPSLGVTQNGPWAGAWIGVSEHKNGLGGTLSVIFLILTYALFTTRFRLVILAGLLTCAVLMVGAQSATAILVTLIGIVASALVFLLQRNRQLGMLVFLVLGVIAPLALWIFVAHDLGSYVVDSLGKDNTLGSRLGIWTLVWPYIEDRWWLGYGYGAFWQGDLPWVDLIEQRLRFVPHYSHNGFVELLLGGGFLMLMLAAWVYLGAFVKSWVPVLREPLRYEHGFVVVFMVTFILRNLTEAAALTRNDIIWLLFVALAAGLARTVTLSLAGRPRSH